MNTIQTFSATIDRIGVNPFVFLPEAVLTHIFQQAQKNKGPIPVRGTINGKPYRQTLVHYQGAWRLYINLFMLKNSPKRIGETVIVTIDVDPDDRSIPMHPKLKTALEADETAKAVFDRQPPSRQKEILRYIHRLKNDAAVDRNVTKAIQFLLGNERFIGRDRP